MDAHVCVSVWGRAVWMQVCVCETGVRGVGTCTLHYRRIVFEEELV